MKKVFFIVCLCCLSQLVLGCTTFCINKNGQIIFGRNYDWVTGAGIVNTNQRGLFKTSFKQGNEEAINWVSKYGSITFNQYGKEFPTGGMNEKGLVVEMMWLDGSVYPAADNRPAIGVLQWIQYQLDNASTVKEVIGSDSKIRISDNDTPLHYLVADAAGNVASIEFLNGKMVVHKEKELPFPVLTNERYDVSVKTAKPFLNQKEVTLDNNSLERFVKACSMVKRFHETNVDMHVTDYAFSILDKVSQGSFTKWSIVYDISNKKIYFKTNTNKKIKSFQFTAFNFSCNTSAKMYNMNQDAVGDIANRFILPDKNIKAWVMNQVIAEGISRVPISKKEEEVLLNYEYGTICKQQ